MAPPLYGSGMVVIVSAIGPCAKRLGQRGLAVTQARQRDLAVTALVVLPACLLPLHRKVSLSSPRKSTVRVTGPSLGIYTNCGKPWICH